MDSQVKPPRVIRFWRTRKTDVPGVDRRPKKVRSYTEKCDLEAVLPSTYRRCAYHACPKHGMISRHSALVRVVYWPGARYRRFPETKDFHPGCLPPELREAAGMLLWP